MTTVSEQHNYEVSAYKDLNRVYHQRLKLRERTSKLRRARAEGCLEGAVRCF